MQKQHTFALPRAAAGVWVKAAAGKGAFALRRGCSGGGQGHVRIVQRLRCKSGGRGGHKSRDGVGGGEGTFAFSSVSGCAGTFKLTGGAAQGAHVVRGMGESGDMAGKKAVGRQVQKQWGSKYKSSSVCLHLIELVAMAGELDTSFSIQFIKCVTDVDILVDACRHPFSSPSARVPLNRNILGMPSPFDHLIGMYEIPDFPYIRERAPSKVP
ncbi:hypothetical protein B0H19DRAFT_1265131 [Mycena capillaripes]|nr:hypothetical protein B0H19DRAFT_1265131 [Mycena capillaripes]